MKRQYVTQEFYERVDDQAFMREKGWERVVIADDDPRLWMHDEINEAGEVIWTMPPSMDWANHPNPPRYSDGTNMWAPDAPPVMRDGLELNIGNPRLLRIDPAHNWRTFWLTLYATAVLLAYAWLMTKIPWMD